MRTACTFTVGDAADIELADEGMNLVVALPSYPTIEMWGDLFSARDGIIDAVLDAGDGDAAFEATHEQSDAAWDRVARVLALSGVACVNVGDATQSLDGSLRQYPDHARVLATFGGRGLTPLPDAI